MGTSFSAQMEDRQGRQGGKAELGNAAERWQTPVLLRDRRDLLPPVRWLLPAGLPQGFPILQCWVLSPLLEEGTDQL